MNITEETVEHLADITNLKVSSEEKIKLVEELKKIFDYVEIMNDIDTDGIEPMSHVLDVTNVFREDVIENKDTREQLLRNAPEQKDGSFVVPKAVD
ncbi:MAG: Asp-tRNA(Asn)/Glu-tRNA(Gln) amidotransferase subunit GatC [Clostridiales bacterium]|nr:Asp-tRNA(Asn)/Glu-tRNA(Gln) amidotransferase subunit GatC [Clostridiales bacterium]